MCRRLSLLSSVAVSLFPVAGAKSNAAWLSGRDGRFLQFRQQHSCTPVCRPSCIVENPCECVSLLPPAPCAPPLLTAIPDVGSSAPLLFSAGAWNMSPTGHATAFLDSGRAGSSSFPSDLTPLYVLPPGGGFGNPVDTPPGGFLPPPYGGTPSGPPNGPPGEPPPPPSVDVKPTPAPPAIVLLVTGVVGLVAIRRRFVRPVR